MRGGAHPLGSRGDREGGVGRLGGLVGGGGRGEGRLLLSFPLGTDILLAQR